MPQVIKRSPLSLLGFLGLTLLSSPVAAQVFDSGPSDPALFDTVINVPTAPNIGDSQSIGGDGLSTQLNIFDGGSVGQFFEAKSDSEVNISGGDVGIFFKAASGSVVHISGGNVDILFNAQPGSVININGGEVGEGFRAFNSMINLFGRNFVLDGSPLNSLVIDDAFTIVDRDVILTGLLADGSPFSFNLASVESEFGDFFSSDTTLTVTLVDVILGDANQDGVVNFDDIPAFIEFLTNGTFLAEADCNQDGLVDCDDIPVFVEILIAG